MCYNSAMEIIDNKVQLSLNNPQSSIRISDSDGNHTRRPTKVKKTSGFSIEWMIRNSEIVNLVSEFLKCKDRQLLIKKLKSITDFAEESEFSKRETIKLTGEEKGFFAGFKIVQYTENFSSFEKKLKSGIKVRITFKLGDYGVKPHPHMYVLVPFTTEVLEIKNKVGTVKTNQELGSKCRAQLRLDKNDIFEIVTTLAHASKDHRQSLVEEIKKI